MCKYHSLNQEFEQIKQKLVYCLAVASTAKMLLEVENTEMELKIQTHYSAVHSAVLASSGMDPKGIAIGK